MRPALLRALAFSALLLAAGCASLPPGAELPKPASSALEPSADSGLGRIFEPLAAANKDNSGFRMISVGIDGLTVRVEMIDL